jgi:hypothetical protein
MWGIFQRKFEWLFNYRDESNLNAQIAPVVIHRDNTVGMGVSAVGEYLVTLPVVAALTNCTSAAHRK